MYLFYFIVFGYFYCHFKKECKCLKNELKITSKLQMCVTLILYCLYCFTRVILNGRIVMETGAGLNPDNITTCRCLVHELVCS